MSRPQKSITLSISDEDKALLESLALDFGLKWGDRPNVSKFIEAIARKRILTSRSGQWSEERLEALRRGFHALIDQGQMIQARAVGELLLERGEVSASLRRQIEQFMERPQVAWRLHLEEFIEEQQPFRLMYQDAAGRVRSFTVCHGAIVFHEKRQYLDCWCEETEGNADIAALCHNWSLRLDRIPEAAVSRADQPWREDLDRITVTFDLYQQLAVGYQVKNEDLSDQWQQGHFTRRITRRITSSFWFLREVLPYGALCELIDPPDIRERIRQAIHAMVTRYQIDP
ncbi:MAG: WYL domain-containing protein [Oscillatoriales cyanobacterium SM2_2_1]|nr:WYL domain-containing protein [Oscillatoriales cyanobacterium SM2_2_1]